MNQTTAPPNDQVSEAPKGNAEKPKYPERSYTPPESLSEAGGSISGRVFAMSKDGRVISEIQLTARGLTARDALDNFMDAIAYGKARYRLAMEEPTPQAAPAPITPLQGLYTPPQAPTSPVSPDQGVLAPPPPQNPTQGFTGAPPQGGIIRAVKLEIEIRQDGRANLQFFEAGHKWADLSTVRSIEDACVLLAPIGGFNSTHIVNGATYSIDAMIYWTPGKINSKGKPYKDIADIRKP